MRKQLKRENDKERDRDREKKESFLVKQLKGDKE